MCALPVRSVVGATQRVGREHPRGPIAVVGEPAAVEAARGALLAGGGHPALLVSDVERAGAIVYAGSSIDDLVAAARAARGRPFAALVPAALHPEAYRVPGAPGTALAAEPAALAPALAGRLRRADAALVSRLPALRDPYCRARINRSSAAAGALVALGRGSRPASAALLALQTRLVLRLAAAHGRPVSAGSARELVGTFAAAAGFRAYALRSGPGRFRRAGIAAAGTQAIGEAALLSFRAAQRVADATATPARATR
jgi:hypothetical protein